jgi:uncharacterized alkaline shock family protein YloU
MTGDPAVRFHVADAVVVRVARLRAARVPGVVAVRPGTTATVHGADAEVRLGIVTSMGHNVRDVAQEVQRAVAAELAAYAGLAAVVAVTVTDVVAAETTGDRPGAG